MLFRSKDVSGEDLPNEGVKWTDEHIFSEIARMEREHPYLAGRTVLGVADPSIWAGEESGISRADTAAKCGVHFERGNNERIPGWMQVHYRLAFDDMGYPMMYIFDNCRAFIRTMPLLVFDEHADEDLDSSDEDHVADEVRYFCMMNPIKPRENKIEYAPVLDPLNQYSRRRRH